MLFKLFESIRNKRLLAGLFIVILFVVFLFLLIININSMSKSDRDIFAYTVKVRDAVEEIDKIFERAELNVYLMSDSIASSYDETKQKNESYNMQFVKDMDGLIKSVLANSPGVNGSWFQLNADLPYSSRAYNWYEFENNQFVNVRDELNETSSADREVTQQDDPYYFDAVDKKKPVWSAIYTDADTNEQMITISSPIIKQQGVLVGVVGIDILVANIRDALKNMQSDLNDSELYLLDKSGKLILSQSYSNMTLTKEPYGFSNLFKGRESEPIEYRDNLKQKTAIMITLSNDYKLVISIENKKLFKSASKFANLIYIIFGFFAVLAVMIFIYQSKVFEKEKITETEGKESTEDEGQQDEDYPENGPIGRL